MYLLHISLTPVYPDMSSVILLWLTSDGFTRQKETSAQERVNQD